MSFSLFFRPIFFLSLYPSIIYSSFLYSFLSAQFLPLFPSSFEYCINTLSIPQPLPFFSVAFYSLISFCFLQFPPLLLPLYTPSLSQSYYFLTWYVYFQTFLGNNDGNSIIYHKFEVPFLARFVRLNIKSYSNASCLRLEVYGCSAPTIAPTTKALTTKCPEYSCDNETKCIPNRWICDGSYDCIDQSDENKCNRTCR